MIKEAMKSLSAVKIIILGILGTLILSACFPQHAYGVPVKPPVAVSSKVGTNTKAVSNNATMSNTRGVMPFIAPSLVKTVCTDPKYKERCKRK